MKVNVLFTIATLRSLLDILPTNVKPTLGQSGRELVNSQTSQLVDSNFFGNSAVQVRHLRSDAYSAEEVLLNKRQICGGTPKLHWYHFFNHGKLIVCLYKPNTYTNPVNY